MLTGFCGRIDCVEDCRLCLPYEEEEDNEGGDE
jgi:hypothetical protein